MQKNVAGQRIGAQLVSAVDGSAFTGAVTVRVTGDAGTQAVGSVGSGACAHEGNGYHTYAPAQAETNYDLIAFTFTGSGAVPATVQVYTRFAGPTAAEIWTYATRSVDVGEVLLSPSDVASLVERLLAAKNFKPNPAKAWVLRRNADAVGSTQVRRKKAGETLTLYADASPLLSDGESIDPDSIEVEVDAEDTEAEVDVDSIDVLGGWILFTVSGGNAGEIAMLTIRFQTTLDQEVEAEVPLTIGS